MDERALALMRLTGYALAQALWQVADGTPLCTFAIWELEQANLPAPPDRQVARVDAESVEVSMATARRNLGEIERLLRWAIAAEGEVKTPDGRVFGAIRVEFGAHDTALEGEALYFFAKSPFQMVQGPVIRLVGGEAGEELRNAVIEGMHVTRPEEEKGTAEA